jgi:UDPglucose 6-dehydrogenase
MRSRDNALKFVHEPLKKARGSSMLFQALNIVVIGTGYVGISTAVLLAFLGHRVTGIDVDLGKIARLKLGEVTIHEPGLTELLASCQQRLEWRTQYDDVSNADVVYICVGTPCKSDGTPDLQYIASAAASIAPFLVNRLQIIVNKSTVPIGTSDHVQSLLKQYSPSFDALKHMVVSNPEFLREGSALNDSLYPDRLVFGGQAKARDVLVRLYAPLIEQSFMPPKLIPRPPQYAGPHLLQTTVHNAEMIKYAANAFLALKISFANEIAGLCEHVGADIEEVTVGIGMDHRIGPSFLQAGLGWGGSCFGKDTLGLISAGRKHGYTMPILQAAIDVNYRQRQMIVERLLRQLKTLKGKRVTILGLAFKPNTDDLRDAPAHDLIQRLSELGAQVTAHDPIAIPRAEVEWANLTYTLASSLGEAFRNADAIVIATEWDEYKQLDWNPFLLTMRHPLVIDARNVIRFPVNARVERIGREALQNTSTQVSV